MSIHQKISELKLSTRKSHKNKYKIIESKQIALIYTENIRGKIDGVGIIDLWNLDRVLSKGKWHFSENYIKLSENGNKDVFLHRFIAKCNNKDFVVDLFNHKKNDCRESNLRICKKYQDSQNKIKPMPFGSTGYLNVNKSKKYGLIVRLKYRDKDIIIKRSKTKSEKEMWQIAKYARAYLFTYSQEYQQIPCSEIPQWIKDRIDKLTNNSL